MADKSILSADELEKLRRETAWKQMHETPLRTQEIERRKIEQNESSDRARQNDNAQQDND